MSLRPIDPSQPGLNYSFSERIIRVLALAREEAARMGSVRVHPQHVLLGLLQTKEATGFRVLKGLGANLVLINGQVRQSLEGKGAPLQEDEETSFTSEAKELLHYALAEARELDSTYVGTEHLLHAFLRQEDTIPCQALRDAGVTLEKARAETRKVWEAEGDFP